MAVTGGRGVYGGRGHAGTTAADIASGSSGVGIGQREDLANFISMITRDETPFVSSIGKTKATSIYHEWQTDTLQAPGNSKIEEGTDFIDPGHTLGSGGNSPFSNPDQASANIGEDFNNVGPNRTRLGNYCQINGKTISISGTRRVIDSAGVADEYAYQLKKRGTELRRDIEHDLVHKYQTANGSGQRRAAGFQAWINDSSTVVYADSDIASPANNQGTGRETVSKANNTAADITLNGSLSLSDIDQVMQNIYEEGGKATRIMLSPKLRRDFSDLMVNDSGVRRNLDEKGKLRQSVDVYMSDFGDLMVVPNYIMGLDYEVPFRLSNGNANANNTTNAANSCALVYDPQWFAMATLRPLQEVEVGQRGDSTLGMMVEEFTMECKNPVGCGAIYGLS